MMDDRIKGLSPRQITKKFVRDNLLECEAREVYTKVGTESRTQAFDLYSATSEDLVEQLKEVIDFVTEHSVTYASTDDYNLNVTYDLKVLVSESPVDHYQRLWKTQLKQQAENQKELAEYERLKSKFEVE